MRKIKKRQTQFLGHAMKKTNVEHRDSLREKEAVLQRIEILYGLAAWLEKNTTELLK